MSLPANFQDCVDGKGGNMFSEAKWIWENEHAVQDYNQTALFHRRFTLPRRGFQSACIPITADSWYRLKINSTWINDGPCRSYPERYQYDVIDITDILKPGVNHVECLVRYLGGGSSHRIPQQAGLLAQVEIDGQVVVYTDRNWSAAVCPALPSNTPRIVAKGLGFELYDARLKPGKPHPAVERFDWNAGPWGGLHPRDCRLMARRPFGLQRFEKARRLQSNIWCFSIPAQRLLHPKQTDSHFANSLGCGAAFLVRCLQAREYAFLDNNLDVYLNGKHVPPTASLTEPGKISFRQGDNLMLLLARYPFGNPTELSLAIADPEGLQFSNPVSPESEKTCFLTFPEFHYESGEIPRHMWANRELRVRQQKAGDYFALLGKTITDAASLQSVAGQHLTMLGAESFSRDQAFWQFRSREPRPAAATDVIDPENALYDNWDYTFVNPTDSGEDIELLYDFGAQNCGYWEFALNAPAGTIVDLFAVEHINPQGILQHTQTTRNGMRYVCRQGFNRYLSLERRSGRYLFVTLRNLTAAAKIRHVRSIESTYPVNPTGDFRCNDDTLNRIWDICVRSIKLCMEDVFSDCPCYEQSYWLGDARNIALYSYGLYAPWDLGRRCLRLGGYSLDRTPLANSHAPSGWDCVIPAFSFLWCLAIWDYYDETGDREFIAEIYPYLRKNLEGACDFIEPETGVLKIYAWNLFEWTETDNYQPRMLVDSTFLAQALRVGMDCAGLLGKTQDAGRWRKRRQDLNAAINRSWDDKLGGYPDSVRRPDDEVDDDLPPNLTPILNAQRYPGPCRDTSVHTSMLAVLYDVAAPECFSAAAENVFRPQAHMIQPRNMFARFYLYQCLEKLGRSADITPRLKQDYAPMLELDSTTTWESFSDRCFNRYKGLFPTRSHCHAWSAGAVYFFQRLILGLRRIKPGENRFELSPEVGNLDYARGRRATTRGPVAVNWRKSNDSLYIETNVPAGVELVYKPNRSHSGMNVFWNRRPVQEMHSLPVEELMNRSG